MALHVFILAMMKGVLHDKTSRTIVPMWVLKAMSAKMCTWRIARFPRGGAHSMCSMRRTIVVGTHLVVVPTALPDMRHHLECISWCP